MKTETYKGRKLKAVKGRGADWGYARVTLNGTPMGKWQGDEDAILAWMRGTIDHADQVGVGSGRYGAEWYAPGTYEPCPEGHAKPLDGPCGHHWCVEQAEAVSAPETAAEGFYVSVRKGEQAAFLLGPYATHDEALANVDRAKAHALEFYPLASFCGFGTCKATAKPGRELRPGKFNDAIGLTAR